jgi:hypothetical protein
MIPIEGLLAYTKWITDNDHEIESYQDYGDCGLESIRCRAKGCYASKYEWDSDHVSLYIKEMTGLDA